MSDTCGHDRAIRSELPAGSPTDACPDCGAVGALTGPEAFYSRYYYAPGAERVVDGPEEGWDIP